MVTSILFSGLWRRTIIPGVSGRQRHVRCLTTSSRLVTLSVGREVPKRWSSDLRLSPNLDRPCVHISKNPALIDDCLDIQITGLDPGTEVTVLSRVQHVKDRFYAYGYYKANGLGRIELTHMECNGGTYSGKMENNEQGNTEKLVDEVTSSTSYYYHYPNMCYTTHLVSGVAHVRRDVYFNLTRVHNVVGHLGGNFRTKET